LGSQVITLSIGGWSFVTTCRASAWAMQDVAPDIIERVYAMLPENLCARLPAARAAFDARCERVWGRLKAGAARTPIPNPRGE